MDFRNILGQLNGIVEESKMADIKGKKHTGKYGTEYNDDEEGDEGHEKKKRGGQESEATKDSKKWQGAADAAKLISGGKKASLKDWVESAEEAIMERAKNKYAIGMAQAMKSTGDKPPLKKSTINKAHEIAKKVKEDSVSEELKGGQKKLDKNKNGELDSQDFKMLRKSKVKESVNFQEMMAEKQRKVDEMLEELQQEIAEFKTTGHMGDKLRDALDVHSYSVDAPLIGEEADPIGDEIRHGQDVQRDKDMARSDLWHSQDMSRLGDEARAETYHSQDVQRDKDMARSDLWRSQDLARDKAMASLPQKPELDENPFSYAAKQAKAHHDKTFTLGGKTFPVKEGEEKPRLKTTQTSAGTEVTSSTGRVKATFEPGKDTKVEPVKEGGASGYTDEEMKAMDRAVSRAQEANRRETERQYNNVWTDYDHPASPDEGPVGKAPARKKLDNPKIDTPTKTDIPKRTLPKNTSTVIGESEFIDWNSQVESIINESLTVSTTQSDQGDDSVSVTASGDNAAEVLALLRNAGIGGLGPIEHEEEPEQQFSNYGVPISADHKPQGHVEVVSAGDGMAELMKALTDIESDYADEESGHSEDMCQECGVYESSCECDEGHQMVDEDDDVEAAKQGIAAGSPAAQAAAPAAPEPVAAEPDTRGAAAMASSSAPAAPAAAANPSASNSAMSALTGGASTPKADTTAAMPGSQVAGSEPAKAAGGQEWTTVGKSPMSQGTQVPSYKSFGDFFNKITGKTDAAAKQADQNKAGSEMGAGYAKAATATDQQAAAATQADQNKAGSEMGAGYAKAAQAGAQQDQNKAGSELGAGYAKAATDTANLQAAQQENEPKGINPAVLGKQAGATTKATGKASYAPNAGGVPKQASTQLAKPPKMSTQTASDLSSQMATPFARQAGQNTAGSNIGAGYAQAAKAGQAMAGKPGAKVSEEMDENLESARPVEEDLANSADDQATQDINFMTRVISGGLNKEKVQHKHGYQFGDNPLAMKEGATSANDLLHDYRKLSGIK